ncbi:MAG: penicillin-binding protein 2 [Chitinispirillaceae bacterium]|nr:penicillin-binding protein 2 [Chitinispirillaceae bacterium]
MPYLYDEPQERHAKSRFLIIVLSLLFAVLVVRLMYLQIIQAGLNIRLSRENSMRLKIITPHRGHIFDRNGEVLARNRPSYSLCVLPYQLKQRNEVIRKLCAIRDSSGRQVFDSAGLESKIRKAFGRKFDLTRLKEDISFGLMSVVEEHSMELPGITVEAESRREYPMGPQAFHVLGYMGEIPEKGFDSLRLRGYYYGDFLGISGIEWQYEKVLRGTCGQEYIEVDAHGKMLGPMPSIPKIDAVAGSDLYLTLDARLQRAAAQEFPDTLRGAVVALDPRTGEVLAMVSSPSVDPNIFSMAGPERSRRWEAITTDPAQPLNNRAISGTYPPGSTFKLVTMLAGLESGELSPSTRMPLPCRGTFRIGARIARCWDERGHGYLDLIDAVQKSCDIYFYQVGLRLGDTVINRYARMVGLGALSGIDLPAEKEGWLSGEEAYNSRFKSRGWVWTEGLLLDHAIGQTQVATPLQLALMAGGIGHGRLLCRPYIVKGEKGPGSAPVKLHNPVVMDSFSFKSATIAALRDAMRKVIEPGGTGGWARVEGVPVGGKTGSAENPLGEKTHALFVACAPLDDPVIAVAVVAENAGHGGSIAAPIAGKILRCYFAETEEGRIIKDKYKKN